MAAFLISVALIAQGQAGIDNPKLTTEDGKIILGVQDVSNVEIRAGGITARVLTEQDAVEEFDDLMGPSSNRRKRKRFRAPSKQHDPDGRPQKHNRTERTTAQIPAAVEHAPPLIEYHVRTNEDDIPDEDDVLLRDDAPDEDDAGSGYDRQQHGSADPNRRRRRRRADEAPSDRQLKRTASSTNTTTPGR